MQQVKLHDNRITLLQGNCFDWLPKIKANAIDMVFADLPYGTTRNKWDSVLPLDKLWFELKRLGRDTTPYVATAQCPFDKILGVSNLSMLKYEWIWAKENGTGHLNALRQPLRNHENILAFYTDQCTYNPQMREGKPYTQKSGRGSTNYGAQVSVLTENSGERYPLTIIPFTRDKNKLHPTQKPTELLEYLIKTYTNENDVVLDPTMGSGTTAVACINTNRRCIGIELDETYFQIAVDRCNEASNGLQ